MSVQLHANILLEYENQLFNGHASLPATGSYNLGRHTVALDPPEDDRLALFCVFDGHNLDRCDGYIAHEASMDICAEFVFVRQHGPSVSRSLLLVYIHSNKYPCSHRYFVASFPYFNGTGWVTYVYNW